MCLCVCVCGQSVSRRRAKHFTDFSASDDWAHASWCELFCTNEKQNKDVIDRRPVKPSVKKGLESTAELRRSIPRSFVKSALFRNIGIKDFKQNKKKKFQNAKFFLMGEETTQQFD